MGALGFTTPRLRLEISEMYMYSCYEISFVTQALAEVLKSIDSNIQRLHEAAAAQGGFYTADQRNTLE